MAEETKPKRKSHPVFTVERVVLAIKEGESKLVGFINIPKDIQTDFVRLEMTNKSYESNANAGTKVMFGKATFFKYEKEV
jgi:hypothetical protein